MDYSVIQVQEVHICNVNRLKRMVSNVRIMVLMGVKLVGITEQEGLNMVRKHPITKMGTIQNLYSRLEGE
jgi:hypothetical protein